MDYSQLPLSTTKPHEHAFSLGFVELSQEIELVIFKVHVLHHGINPFI